MCIWSICRKRCRFQWYGYFGSVHPSKSTTFQLVDSTIYKYWLATILFGSNDWGIIDISKNHNKTKQNKIHTHIHTLLSCQFSSKKHIFSLFIFMLNRMNKWSYLVWYAWAQSTSIKRSNRKYDFYDLYGQPEWVSVMNEIQSVDNNDLCNCLFFICGDLCIFFFSLTCSVIRKYCISWDLFYVRYVALLAFRIY